MAYDFDILERENSEYPDPRDQLRANAAAPLALLADLRLARRLLPIDPDAAGLLLDGVLWRIVALVFARSGRAAPSHGNALADLESISQPLAWRLRLALRAPHSQARLIHAWALLDAVREQCAGAVASNHSVHHRERSSSSAR